MPSPPPSPYNYSLRKVTKAKQCSSQLPLTTFQRTTSLVTMTSYAQPTNFSPASYNSSLSNSPISLNHGQVQFNLTPPASPTTSRHNMAYQHSPPPHIRQPRPPTPPPSIRRISQAPSSTQPQQVALTYTNPSSRYTTIQPMPTQVRKTKKNPCSCKFHCGTWFSYIFPAKLVTTLLSTALIALSLYQNFPIRSLNGKTANSYNAFVAMFVLLTVSRVSLLIICVKRRERELYLTCMLDYYYTSFQTLLLELPMLVAETCLYRENDFNGWEDNFWDLMLHVSYCSLFSLTLMFDGVAMITKYCTTLLDLDEIDTPWQYIYFFGLFSILLVFVTTTILMGYAPISWVRFGGEFEDWPGLTNITLSSSLLFIARIGKHIWHFFIPVIVYGIIGIGFVGACFQLIEEVQDLNDTT